MGVVRGVRDIVLVVAGTGVFLDEHIRHDLSATGVAVGLGHAQVGQLQASVLEHAVATQQASGLVHTSMGTGLMGAADREVDPVLAIGIVVGAIGLVGVAGVVGVGRVVVGQVLDVGPPNTRAVLALGYLGVPRACGTGCQGGLPLVVGWDSDRGASQLPIVSVADAGLQLRSIPLFPSRFNECPRVTVLASRIRVSSADPAMGPGPSGPTHPCPGLLARGRCQVHRWSRYRAAAFTIGVGRFRSCGPPAAGGLTSRAHRLLLAGHRRSRAPTGLSARPRPGCAARWAPMPLVPRVV